MFFLGAHLTERALEAVRQKQWIVTEPFITPRRPSDDAVDASFEVLDMTIRPADAQRRDEMRDALRGRRRATLLHQPFDLRHGGREILARAGPARRVNAGLAAKCFDDEA